jgi:outer membrane protein assembly factor BamB
MMRISPLLCAALAIVSGTAPALAGDWVHWRGPEMTGVAREPSLPATFDLAEVGKGNLLWKTSVGGRSSPLLLGKKLLTINAFDPEKLTEGERVTCFDADTGKVLWHYNINVYHAEVVTSRLGWTTLTADPEKGYVYAHTTAGALLCLDTEGKLVWQRHLSEEFGRFTGYGGRIVSPIFDSGLVIVAVVNSSWGDQARGTNRFIAFDGKSGEVVWISTPNLTVNKGTYQSHPVIAVIGGQRLLVAGGSDGSVHGLKVRTGEKVFSHLFSAGAVNPAPVVDGNLVYAAHGEENPEGGPIGRVVCVDASQVKAGKPKLVWEYRRSNRFGLSHPAIADGRLYIADDSAELFCFNAKTGKLLWKYKYGTVSRGAPLINGNKLYVFDVNAKLAELTLNGDKPPEEDVTVEHTFRVPPGVSGFVETHATPIAANGRLYFATSFDTYCVGEAKSSAPSPGYKPLPAETPFDPNAAPVSMRVFPYEARTNPGKAVKLTVEFLDANGRTLPKKNTANGEWSLPLPPKAPTGAQPPALVGTVKADGDTASLTVAPAPPSQQGTVQAKYGSLTAQARVRVAPVLPYANDFERAPVGSAPGGWVNAQGKYVVKQLPDGNKVLSKVNTDGRIPIARANAYITTPDATGYTIECDIMGTEVDAKLPDMGVVANRYSLVMDGKRDPNTNGRTVRIVSWEARPRINKVVPLDWKKDTWYHMKLTVEVGEKTAKVFGKVWEKAQPEPKDWTVEFEDPSPNREGAAALYGYISNIRTSADPGSDIYYDNVKVIPNRK